MQRPCCMVWAAGQHCGACAHSKAGLALLEPSCLLGEMGIAELTSRVLLWCDALKNTAAVQLTLQLKARRDGGFHVAAGGLQTAARSKQLNRPTGRSGQKSRLQAPPKPKAGAACALLVQQPCPCVAPSHQSWSLSAAHVGIASLSCQWPYILQQFPHCFVDACELALCLDPSTYHHCGQNGMQGPLMKQSRDSVLQGACTKSAVTALQALTQTLACRSTEAPQAGGRGGA